MARLAALVAVSLLLFFWGATGASTTPPPTTTTTTVPSFPINGPADVDLPVRPTIPLPTGDTLAPVEEPRDTRVPTAAPTLPPTA